MSINAPSGDLIVNFKSKGISGKEGLGFYLLSFDFDYSMPAWRGKRLIFEHFYARVYTTGDGEKYLGTANPPAPVIIEPTEQSRELEISFELQLNAYQLDLVEKARRGNGVSFDASESVRINVGRAVKELLESGGALSPELTEVRYR